MFVKTHASRLFDRTLEDKLPTYGQMQQPLWEESEGERVREERVSSKKMRVPEKVEKSRNTVFFQSEGRKVGWLKRRARSHLVGWEIKNCTRLWREAHFSPNSLATLRGSYVGVKASCPIEVVSVAFGIFPVNFHTKWLLWHVHVHFNCAGSH